MELSEALKDREKRMYLCERNLGLFALCYFPHYFTHKTPPFHHQIYKDFDSLGKLFKHYILCGFRGSGKTSIAKIDFIRSICYGKKKFMMYTCYDEDASKDNLFDIALELQTNKNVVADFGQLYFDTSDMKKSKKSSISNFLTKNNIRVMASSVKKTVRGKAFGSDRPDHVLMDDFENNKTKKSGPMTKQVKEYIDEMMGGLSADGTVVYCCNKISDTGSVAYLYDKFENNTEGKIFEIALIEDGKITWPSKYVFSSKEAFNYNFTEKNSKKHIISIDALKQTMNSDGRKVFEQEMLNQPLSDGDRLFDLAYVEAALDRAKQQEFTTDGNWKIWEGYKDGHDYRIGVDVSEGYGIDSSVIEVIDTSTGVQVAEYESKDCPPEILANECIEASKTYGDCMICPERNGIGTAVISVIKEKGETRRLTTQMVYDAIKAKKMTKYGWNTNSNTKPKMLFDMKHDFEGGLLIINSIPLLREMRGFGNSDLEATNFSDEISNHFDRIMAIAIANQLKKKMQGISQGLEKPNKLLSSIKSSYSSIGGKVKVNVVLNKKKKGGFKINLS